MEHLPISRIVLGTMTFGYHGHGTRVSDPNVVQDCLDELAARGHRQLDTCYVYGDTTCEQMLGELFAADTFGLAIRFDPLATPHGHEPEVLIANVRASLRRLKTDRVDLLYLSLRDPATPIEATLAAVQQLHDEGVFGELGLSNVSAADVAEYVSIAQQHSWIRPTAYQGLYNALSRAAQIELLPELRRLGVRFLAYNPLAGGAFANGFGREDLVRHGSRFDDRQDQGRFYRSRYWNESYLSALTVIRDECARADIQPTDAALRWLVHHSALGSEHDDGVILGASSLEHLRQNLDAVATGPLPNDILAAIDSAAEITRPVWPPTSRTI
ncbi:aldo/keto reductase [Micromonospora sp. NPDC048839]|uniref:aldo/keto reductase family protein n=1 Tax=Micromonospora sp. NPDC048839 TaxID=3155641 RepID=UPI003411C9A3